MNKGLIIKSIGNIYTVEQGDGRVIPCSIKGKLRLKGIKSTNPVAIGDYVEFEPSADEMAGIITKVCDRRNYIVRRAANWSKSFHIIAANIDQAVLVATLLLPETTTVFMDRFLATAEAYTIPAFIVFNKTDLYNAELTDHMHYLMAVYEKIGYLCLEISVLENKNMDKLAQAFSGKTNLLSGHSGVGKSTIINKLRPQSKLKTAALSGYHLAGKHTTSSSEMLKLECGGYVIDTPGIKGFGLINMEKNEIYHFFPELFKAAKSCHFHNCIHTNEPGCAVLDAVNAGEISQSRYISYLKILDDDREKYR